MVYSLQYFLLFLLLLLLTLSFLPSHDNPFQSLCHTFICPEYFLDADDSSRGHMGGKHYALL